MGRLGQHEALPLLRGTVSRKSNAATWNVPGCVCPNGDVWYNRTTGVKMCYVNT